MVMVEEAGQERPVFPAEWMYSSLRMIAYTLGVSVPSDGVGVVARETATLSVVHGEAVQSDEEG